MIKLTIDNEHDENINVDKALIVVPSYEENSDTHSLYTSR